MALAALVAGCATDLEPPRVASIAVAPEAATLDFLGQSTAFTATITDQYGNAYAGTVAWTSDAPAVFTVNSGGVATAASNGTGTIRAELDRVMGTARVIVNQTPTAVERFGGDAQRGAPGTALLEPVVARILDAGGSPVEGAAVSFSPAEGSGFVTPRIAPADMAGEARASWTLGDAFGLQSLVASVADGPNAVFTATAQRPDERAGSVEVVSGDGQAARPSKALRRPVVVRVLDEHNRPVDEATILFDAPPGHGFADPDSVHTDGRGEAATTWTLGNKVGLQLLTASVPGGPSARVTATGTEGVCGRTPQIEDALMRAAGVNACADVTDAVLSRIDHLNLGGLGIGRISEDDFAGLSGLVELNLNSNRLEELTLGVFAELPNLEVLRLAGNQFADLEPGVFTGLSNLRSLLLWGNLNHPLDLEPGIFTGLSNLGYLSLGRNRLTGLEPGVFDGLSNLKYLFLSQNQLTDLGPGVFAGLSNLEVLRLWGNQLNLRSGMFAELSNLPLLDLQYNQLVDLPSGVFTGLSNLGTLYLGGNRLNLTFGVFAELSNLEYLGLHESQLTALPAGAFAGLSNLESLDLYENQLTALPAGAFAGLGRLKALWLDGNPGSPMPMVMHLERTDTTDLAAPGPARVVATVDEGAPFNIRVILSAPGATLSPTWVTIPTGATQSNMVTVSANAGSMGSITVTVGEAAIPRTWCSFHRRISQGRGTWSGSLPCYQGIVIGTGDAIRLFR